MEIRGRRHHGAATTMLVLLLAACAATPSPSGSAVEAGTVGGTPTTSAAVSADPSTQASEAPTTAAGPSTAPTAAPAPWDPTRVAVGFSTLTTVPGRPLAITNSGDGSGRIFVAEQGGKVYVIRNGSTIATPFLDISGQVSNGGEQGLLGIAFHPSFSTDHRVFVDYTDGAGDTVISSFRVDPGTPDTVIRGSEVVILTVDQPYSNHNGGAIQFGPDGYLYIALGDGGSGGDPQDNGQRLDTLLGKILRIDIDHPSGANAYGIPGSNPFVATPGARGEIWLFGLRNPFRFSFDRSAGDLWIGDVGQGAWEEVDVARAGIGGLNFGWRVMEGAHCYAPSTGCSTAGMVLPVTEYGHEFGCAIIGGNVYRGAPQPVLRGGYVFSDACTGITWAVNAAGSGPQALVKVADGPSGIAGYGEDEAGELYAADLDGRIYRVTATSR